MQSNRKSKNRFGGLASWLTFGFLELICFLLIVTQNSRQRGIASQTWTVYSSAVTGKVGSWYSIFGLRSQLDSIQNREAELLERLIASSLVDTTDLRRPLIDSASLDVAEQYELSAARIVTKQPYSRSGNSFIINKGKRDGLTRGQGVVGSEGPMGIVTDVSNRYSRVMSVLHPDIQISAALSNLEYGTLRWGGENPRQALLLNIPDYVDPPESNDTIYTTGYSAVFPTRMPIGRTRSFVREAGSGFWKIEVSLFENYLSTDRVFVVNNLHKPELDSLRSIE
ncbi:MAG: rod shape-determining protein MreC [Bacteroidota bacterium]